MKLPNLRRLWSPDFPADYQDLVDKLAGVLNINQQVLFDVLNKKVSIRDNIDCAVKDFTVQVGSDGIPISSTILPLEDKTRGLVGLEVIRATNLTNSAVYPTGGVFVTWQQVQTGVQILHVTGLPTGNQFSLRIIGYY